MTSYGGYGRAVRRRHPLRTTIIVLIVLLALLVALDFAARAFAENEVAAQIQKQGFPKKPDVSIEGFPFLTQVISRNFGDVQLSSDNVSEGALDIQSVKATMTGVHVNSSFNGGTVGRLSGTILVTFPALANAMTAQAGGLSALLGGRVLTLSYAGDDEVKTALDLAIASGTAVWKVVSTGHKEISVRLVSAAGLTSALLGSISTINLPLPSLPLGLSIQNVKVTPGGLVGTVTGQNVTFGG